MSIMSKLQYRMLLLIYTDPVSFSDVGIQSVILMVHVDVQTDEINLKNTEI